MKKLVLLLFALLGAGVFHTKAQDRVGFGITMVSFSTNKYLFKSDYYTEMPRPTLHMQRWFNKNSFLHYSLDYQRGKIYDDDIPGQEMKDQTLNMLNFHFGQGRYFGRKRFEDNTAIYGTYGFAFGLGYVKNESRTIEAKVTGNEIVYKDSRFPIINATAIALGIGLEQRIAPKLFLSLSADINIGLQTFAGFKIKVLKARY